MNKTLFSVIVAFLFIVCSAAWAQPSLVYKCRSGSGEYSYQGTPCFGKSSQISSWTPPVFKGLPQKTEDLSTLLVQQSEDRYYRVNGAVNGSAVTFIIDTGATVLSLPKDVADRAGIVCIRGITTKTANGDAHGCESVIEKLTFGKFSLRNVRALIMPDLSQPLLGINVLDQFNVEHKNGVMKIMHAG